MAKKKQGIRNLLNRDPPDWQNQKLILARKLVEQQKEMIQQNKRIIQLLEEISQMDVIKA